MLRQINRWITRVPRSALMIIQNDENLGFARLAIKVPLVLPPTICFSKSGHQGICEYFGWQCSVDGGPGEPPYWHTGSPVTRRKRQVTRTCAKFLATRYFVNRMLGLSFLWPKMFPELLDTQWTIWIPIKSIMLQELLFYSPQHIR